MYEYSNSQEATTCFRYKQIFHSSSDYFTFCNRLNEFNERHERRNDGLPEVKRAPQCGSLLFKIFILNAPFD